MTKKNFFKKFLKTLDKNKVICYNNKCKGTVKEIKYGVSRE